ncbi:DUF3300 domain-containing protein (plasmid) [Rhizobium sp. CB3171]|uniref:DUF3300 domain-containing protein n=1 Tax=Rhizobium sp. CB3171 TaxID=3039157 RepID=UPI0024B164B6|nr:DUF3300 domain-containing protein [Rhizobium sp. CB3171]WFU04745.1 DUF3300 domain-containing protein [Rhizobium sp. CB3171]
MSRRSLWGEIAMGMKLRELVFGLSAVSLLAIQAQFPAYSQTSASSAPPAQAAENAPALLSDDELEVLVARIALYPDELVAAISAASLFPLQIVEAQRFLEAKKKNADLKPKSDWDGSVISLLNYPEVVKMMSDDLEWTQAFGNALTNQQKDVLIAIQQLRDEAVAKKIIKSDDKITVVTENDNVIIQPTNPEKIYVPQYAPEMLYEPGYASEPIGYYSDSYPSYYYPGATFFAAAITGVAWAAAVNWNDWGVWGGNWRGDVDIDCNNCFNNRNFNGKVKWNDVDWKNVDRSKLSIGKDQLAKMDRSAIGNNLRSEGGNDLRSRAENLNRERSGSAADRVNRAADVRRDTAQGLKQKPTARTAQGANRPANVARAEPRSPKAATGANRGTKAAAARSGQQKLASRPDNRGRQPSALGNVSSGRREMMASQRGRQSMGAAHRPPPRSMHRGGGRPMPHGGGRGGGGRGGGGRGRR